MIEKIVLDYLKGTLTVPVWMEIPEGETLPGACEKDKNGGI